MLAICIKSVLFLVGIIFNFNEYGITLARAGRTMKL